MGKMTTAMALVGLTIGISAGAQVKVPHGMVVTNYTCSPLAFKGENSGVVGGPHFEWITKIYEGGSANFLVVIPLNSATGHKSEQLLKPVTEGLKRGTTVMESADYKIVSTKKGAATEVRLVSKTNQDLWSICSRTR